MQQRVTAILVVRSGAEYLERTIGSLQRQSRRPDSVIAVDLESDDGSRDRLAEADFDHLVGAAARSTFGESIGHAIDVSPPDTSEHDWLWLLAYDNAPEPDALARLLGAVEIAPSVSIAGPKLMRWQQGDVIAEFGESMTRFGASVDLVAGELDQAQHDVQADVLAVAAGGMLVRRSVWTGLGGFDPGLPSTDAALDFSVRARLAGHRVVVVPDARVATAGGPQHFGRRSVSESRRARIARAAQVHRRLVYAPLAAVPVHWLSLVPLAILRSVVHLLAKHPGSVGAEFRAAFATAFGLAAVARARRRLARSKRLRWGAIAPLRITRRQAREQLAERHEILPRSDEPQVYREAPIGFVAGGGLWAVVAAGVVGLIAFGNLLGQNSVVGGGMLALSSDAAELWANIGWGRREIGAGSLGASDPFAILLALGGTLTFWQPSISLLLLYLLALPLAAIGAFFCARRLAARPWLPALAAALWGLAPPLLGSLDAGRPGAVIAHLMLPWLVVAALNALRSWSSAAAAALLFAGVIAAAPILAPALLLLWVAFLASHPRRAHRLIGIPLPAAAVFTPLVIDQMLSGNPIALLADPGVPVGGSVATSGIQLAFGSSAGDSLGWPTFLENLQLTGAAAPFVVAALLLPLGVLAIITLFVRGSRRAMPALAVALLGFVTAVLASRLDLGAAGPESVTGWPGAGLSLFWLGLLGATVVSLDALERGAVGSGVLVAVASALVVVPLVSAASLGYAGVSGGADRVLPAIVDAESRARPDVGTLILRPVDDDALEAELQRGSGATLDDQSTLDATSATVTDADREIAVLAGNLASRSGFDSMADLDELAIEFIVLEEPDGDVEAAPVFQRSQEALDGNALLVPVGETTTGLLWRYQAGTDAAATSAPTNTGTAYGVLVLVAQGVVLLATVLLAVPTTTRRRQYTQRGSDPAGPGTTFDQVPDD